MKLFIKGIETREDAKLCLEHGIDGIMVSNHGGRATETYRSTIEALPEVVEAVGGKIPVFVDGGVRRGTDVFKALALGATAVGIGRPQNLGAGGVWAGGGGPGAGDSAGRAQAGHGQLRDCQGRGDQPVLPCTARGTCLDECSTKLKSATWVMRRGRPRVCPEYL